MYTIESTGTTPSGVAYTICTETIGANIIRWGLPTAALNAGTPMHCFLYAHGSGGSADYFTTRAVFANTRNGILDLGGFWIECGGSELSAFGGANNWARNFSRTAYSNAVQLVATYLTVQDILILGRSMGALIALWLATQDTYIKPKCVGVIHMSGIYSMLDEFDDGNHFDLPSWYGTTAPPAPPTRPDVPYDNSAWATWRNSLVAWRALAGTQTARTALANATVTNDPARFSASLYAGLNVCVVYGTKDNIAWPSITSLKFWNATNAVLGPLSSINAVAGATHDITNGTFDAPAVLDFTRAVWGIAPPTPGVGTIYRVISARQKYPDGLHPFTF